MVSMLNDNNSQGTGHTTVHKIWAVLDRGNSEQLNEVYADSAGHKKIQL